MTVPIRVAVLDDHALVRDGIVALLGTADPAVFDVVYAGEDPAQAAASGADVALLDIDLGVHAPRVEASTAALVAAGCEVLLLSALADPVSVRMGLDAGALGFIAKRATGQALTAAVRSVAAGEVYLTAELAGIIVAGEMVPDLSPRETEALRLYSAGLTVVSVGRRMNVSPSTAKEYLDRVRAKYAAAGRPARTRTELQRVAERDGYVRRTRP